MILSISHLSIPLKSISHLSVPVKCIHSAPLFLDEPWLLNDCPAKICQGK